MNLELEDHEREFRDEVRAFLSESLTQELAEGGAAATSVFCDPAYTLPWQRILHAKGWVAPSWPREFGGPGWSPMQRYIFAEECALAGAPNLAPMGLRMVGPCIMHNGTPEQRAYYLPRILSGEDYWCQGYSEPGAGSDLASLKTKAELTPDGKHYIVNGTKIWTTMGHVANWIFCLTRTQTTSVKQEGITFLLFDMKTPGVEVKPIYTLGGSHHVNQVFFTDVKVPVENRVGEENQGWTYAKGLLQHERKGLAGISRSVFAMEKLKEKVMKVPVGDKTLMETEFKKKIAVAEIDLLALEYTELRTLADMVKNGTTGHASSILKLKGTMMQQTIQELTLEAAGIYGAPWGHQKVGVKFGRSAMEMYLNGRPATIYGGCSEVQRDVIAKRVLGI